MDTIADMGGMQGFGPVVVEQDEPTFHEEWEKRAFAIALLSMRTSGTNLATFRYALETDPTRTSRSNLSCRLATIGSAAFRAIVGDRARRLDRH